MLGITFLPPKDLPDLGNRGLRATLESLPYVDDAAGLPIVWFTDERDEDVNFSVSQDFAASLYVSDTTSWGLALNIDWLPVHQREWLEAALPDGLMLNASMLNREKESLYVRVSHFPLSTNYEVGLARQKDITTDRQS